MRGRGPVRSPAAAAGMSIAVAGAGVAGLAFAALAARAGARPVVFDQFDAPRPVGSGLIIQTTGRRVLSALGLETALIGTGARLARLHGRSVPSGRTVLDVRYADASQAGIAVHRGALHALLLGAAHAAGAAFEFGRRIESASDGRLAFAGGLSSARFDLVVDALGARSPLIRAPALLSYGALWASVSLAGSADFARDALEQRYRRADRMAGVLPVGALGERRDLASYFWSLRADAYDAVRAQGLARWKDEAAALWPQTAPLLDQIGDFEALAFARYSHHRIARPFARGIVHIGDSAHSASPQLGQGANMALLDAFALAQALDLCAGADAACAAYGRIRRGHVRAYQAMSAVFTPVYQSDSRVLPLLRDLAAAPLSRIPPAPRLLTAMVSGTIAAPLRRMGLSLSPRDGDQEHAHGRRERQPHPDNGK